MTVDRSLSVRWLQYEHRDVLLSEPTASTVWNLRVHEAAHRPRRQSDEKSHGIQTDGRTHKRPTVEVEGVSGRMNSATVRPASWTQSTTAGIGAPNGMTRKLRTGVGPKLEVGSSPANDPRSDPAAESEKSILNDERSSIDIDIYL